MKTINGTPTPEDLALINRFTRREMKADEVFVFDADLCDNEINRDGERFPTECLQGLGEMFIGKTGADGHGGDTPMRIYDTFLRRDTTRVNSLGEPYAALRAKIYLPRTEKNAALIRGIGANLPKGVSVSCSVKSVTCSVCGKPYYHGSCAHVKGARYDGVLCHTVHSEPTDVFEFSLRIPDNEINPCGFCYNSNTFDHQGIAVRDVEEGFCSREFSVHCRQCGARGPVEDTPAQAIAAWNGGFDGEVDAG